MDRLETFFIVRTDAFPILPGEDEVIVNPGMYGQAFTEFLEGALAARGYEVGACCEDWGWWIGVEKDQFKSAVCVYNRNEDETATDFAVCNGSMKDWRWVWSKFKKVSIAAEIDALNADVQSIFETASRIDFRGVSDDPFGEPQRPPQ